MNTIKISNTNLPVLFGCDFCVAPEPFFHPDRTPDFHVLIYVTEGRIPVTEANIDYVIEPGELFFLHKGLHHFAKEAIPMGTKWHYIHFFSDDPKPETEPIQPDSSPIPQYQAINFSTTLPKKISGLRKSSLEQHIAAFTDYFHSHEPMKRWDINQKLFELLSEIAFWEQTSNPALELPDQICSYLEKHACEPFSADMLEEHFHLSYKYMAFCFKKEKNLTMQQYHTQIRMNLACRLLKSTLLPIGEISNQVGYTDMLYFSRCFHKYTGKSPSQYRKDAYMLSIT